MAVLPSVICKPEERTIFHVDLKEDPIFKLLQIITNKHRVMESKEDCRLEMMTEKLLIWNEKLKQDSLFFENPFNNFLYTKMLRTDLKLKSTKEFDENLVNRVIRDYILPSFTSESDTFIQNLPTTEDVTKSAQLGM